MLLRLSCNSAKPDDGDGEKERAGDRYLDELRPDDRQAGTAEQDGLGERHEMRGWRY